MNVLSKILDKSAADHAMGYHPKCKNIGTIHFSFADDIMVFTDGKIRSVESIVDVFSYFGKISGLQISMENLPLLFSYVGGYNSSAGTKI